MVVSRSILKDACPIGALWVPYLCPIGALSVSCARAPQEACPRALLVPYWRRMGWEKDVDGTGMVWQGTVVVV